MGTVFLKSSKFLFYAGFLLTLLITTPGSPRAEEPATPEEAEKTYDALRRAMVDSYQAGGNPIAATYMGWQRFNSAPFLSGTHGARYVNTYGNEKASGYGLFEKGGPLPKGAILVRDSFMVSDACLTGDVVFGEKTPPGVIACVGPLFIMEKMEKGFNQASGDWRFTMIWPGGTLFGTTKGPGAKNIDFCMNCHEVAEKDDHIFYTPEEYRPK
ncbi:MAG: cytochrome P460 family protein [Pseudomonadota bacterium]